MDKNGFLSEFEAGKISVSLYNALIAEDCGSKEQFRCFVEKHGLNNRLGTRNSLEASEWLGIEPQCGREDSISVHYHFEVGNISENLLDALLEHGIGARYQLWDAKDFLGEDSEAAKEARKWLGLPEPVVGDAPSDPTLRQWERCPMDSAVLKVRLKNMKRSLNAFLKEFADGLNGSHIKGKVVDRRGFVLSARKVEVLQTEISDIEASLVKCFGLLDALDMAL
jgi:hypothetical protein